MQCWSLTRGVQAIAWGQGDPSNPDVEPSLRAVLAGRGTLPRLEKERGKISSVGKKPPSFHATAVDAGCQVSMAPCSLLRAWSVGERRGMQPAELAGCMAMGRASSTSEAWAASAAGGMSGEGSKDVPALAPMAARAVESCPQGGESRRAQSIQGLMPLEAGGPCLGHGGRRRACPRAVALPLLPLPVTFPC